MTETEALPVVKESQQAQTMRHLIEQYRGHMAKLLGKHVDVEQMFQIALLAMGRNPRLLECTGASILGCVLESSRLSLQAGAGAGETWMVPFKNKHTGKSEAQLIVDYRGLLKLMKEGADVDAVLAEAVHENDFFEYGVDGAKMYLAFKPAKQNRGERIGYVSASWNKEGKLTAIVYKTMEEIATHHKARSKASESGPWQTDEDAMNRKTVIRQLAKLNPYSTTRVIQAVALDEKAELGKPQDLALLADPTAKPTPDAEESVPSQEPPKRASETKKSASGTQETLDAAADEGQETFIPAAISVKSGEKNGRPWTKYGVKNPAAEVWYVTFDSVLGNLARQAKDEKFPIKLTYKYDGAYLRMTDIVRA